MSALLRRSPALWAFLGVVVLGFSIWPELLVDLLNGSGFEPHGACIQWRGDLLTLHVTADTVIGVSYMGISYYLIMLIIRHRQNFGWVPVWAASAFGGFIFFCGLTHFMGVAMFFYPFYWLDGGIKALTALASVSTWGALLWANRNVERSLDAVRQRDALLYDQLKAVTQLQFSLHSKEEDLLTLTDDITRQRAERGELIAQLQASEARFRLAFNVNPIAKLITRAADRIIVDANPAMCRLIGFVHDEMVGNTVDALGIWPDPMEAQRIREQLSSEGSLIEIAIRLRQRSGSMCDVLVSTVPMEIEGEPCFLSIIADHTERNRLEEQFVQAQKMESIGRLAGGIAHDFNNLLTMILGISDLILSGDPLPEQTGKDVRDIQHAARRATEVTRRLLTFARQQVIDPHVIDLNTVLIETSAMLSRVISENIEFVALPGDTLHPVKADAGQINQVLMNLVVNARDAMPLGGKILLETRNVTLDATYVREHAYVLPGDYVLISVSDTGSGMTTEVQRHLFEPFFTTKARDKGTGLGLATCYGIVKQHGGYIWAYSEVGIGTSIKVYLPRAYEPLEYPPQLSDNDVPRGTETILLVEDEPQLLVLASRILRGLGYTVLEATNGDEALRVAMRHEAHIHLLLTDIVMPKMGGKPLADKIHELYPATMILFMSGYTDNTITHAGVLEPGLNFVQKPFTRPILGLKVRRVLDHGLA